VAEVQSKDRRTYSVYGLYVAGSRFVGDFGTDDAVSDYLELHPDADREAVAAELRAEIAKRG
jgi:hypothetical protein